MKKINNEKSDFQKAIENQQRILEELYRKYSKEKTLKKQINIPEEYKQLVVC